MIILLLRIRNANAIDLFFETEQKFIKNKDKWLKLKDTKIFNKEKILLDS